MRDGKQEKDIATRAPKWTPTVAIERSSLVKIRIALATAAVAVLGLFPLSSPASATHMCAEGIPCWHPQDIIEPACYKVAVLRKYFCS
jgi:hypothetical protein